MIAKTVKSFNQFTRHALLEKVEGYVSKSKSLEEEIYRLKKQYDLQKIYRFDLGENVDGFPSIVNDFVKILYSNKILISRLNQYPEITHTSLRERLGAIFKVPRQNIVISAGLDSILDLISRVFFEYKDVFLMPVPGFFLFESYSERMGASPIFLQLNEEDDFRWTHPIFEKCKELIVRFRPKIIWLSNPNNPTGQVIPDEMLEQIIELADAYNIFVVVDEAYHEFIGDAGESAARLTHKYSNLMVLRTFSKAFGLAGIRLGYLICSDQEVIEALLLHRHHFPITQLSLNIAQLATKDVDFIKNTRLITHQRSNILFKKLEELPTFKFVPSKTNIFMLKNKHLTALELDKLFKKRGIIASHLNITGIVKDDYLRITVRTEEDNEYFIKVCKEIDLECQFLS